MKFVPLGFVCWTGMLLGSWSQAQETATESEQQQYIEALHENQFSDLAVEYLRFLEASAKNPADQLSAQFSVAEALMRLAESADPETERRAHDEASERFRKVLADPKAGDRAHECRNQLAYVLLKRGQRSLAMAKMETDPAKADTRRKEARSHFEKAKSDFDAAIIAYQNALKSTDDDRRKRRLRTAYIQARMNRGLVEYFMAISFGEKDAQRKKGLESAARLFGDLTAETSRETITVASIYGKIYQAKSLLDAGNASAAVDVLEEALVNENLVRGRNAVPFRGLFARARHELAIALNAQGRHQDLVSSPVYSAVDWVEKNQATARTSEGMGVQLELSKAYIALAKKEPENSPNRRRLFANALRYLNTVARSSSPYSREAFRTRAEYAGEMRVSTKAATFEEAMESATLLREEGNWKEAAEAYANAVTMVPKNNQDRMGESRYWEAFCRYRAGEFQRVTELAQSIVADLPRGRRTPQSAELGMVSLYQLWRHAPAKEKEAWAKKSLDWAKLIEGQYADVSAADVARRIRGYLMMSNKDYQQAASAFAAVRTDSPTYAECQLRLAQCLLRLEHAANNQKPPKGHSANGDFVERALQAFAKSSKVQRDELLRPSPTGERPDPKNIRITPLLAETELAWTEAYLQHNDPTKAAGLIDPLLSAIQKNQGSDDAIPEALATRILVAGLEIANSQRDYDKADRLVGQLITAQSGDPGQVTNVLIRVGQGLEQQLANQRTSNAADRAKSTLELLQRFLKRMGDRPNQDYRGLRYVADANYRLEQYGPSAEQYQQLLQRLKPGLKDVPPRSFDAEKHYIRMRRITALKHSKAFEKSLEEINAYIAEIAPPNKKSPYPLAQQMEKGRILNAWGTEQTTKLSEALGHWSQVQRTLNTLRRKPVEFYEVRLEIARCLALQNKAQEALQVINQTLGLNPDAGSPHLKAEFEKLRDSLGKK